MFSNIKAYKTYDNILKTHEMIVAVLLLIDKINQIRIFEEIFLVANMSPKLVFRMSFLILSSVNVDFLR